ncbi:TetR/AcrR family transcriptional regulator C-terminal domain-containing protein [Planobispora siamensis]|uniref:TetR family transcriptional regulator n=1 Tax=Planobispora siamensis TaxID=936338 RepID=A0A8J3WR36_9ACTN|nr:TetR/AcrR family transcriptional regulator C-terminal domain-containing protein [Planobispora siamensis]GIH97667.1 TetR family transcriptional regulator [Planobispora siamensis]
MSKNARPGLTRQIIIDTALRLLDEVGLEGLTVRRLAVQLGVQSPALYWHFRTKQELLNGMASAVVLSAGMGPPHQDEPWQSWLARRARAYRRALLAHRDGARLLATATDLGPEVVRNLNAEVTAMLVHGFTPALALRTITTLSHYTLGAVLQEQALQQQAPREQAAPPVGGAPLGPLIAILGGDTEAPLVAAMAVAMEQGSSAGGDANFEHGVQAIITGTSPPGQL